MGKRRFYLLLCVNERAPDNPKGCCMRNGADRVRDRFAEVILRENLRETVRVVKASCLDNCSRGPTLAVYPDDVWYQRVQAEDVEEIIESHIRNGRPVDRLILRPDQFD